MEKVAIITISVGLLNYGNRLQNYALQQFLIGKGHAPETIQYKPKYENLEISLSSGHTRRKLSYYISWIKKKAYVIRNRKLGKEKKLKFDIFTKTKIIWSEDKYTSDSDFSNFSKRYDCAIVGSDQVWNPYWEGTNYIYYLGFMPEEKRIAYAASFGVLKIPDNRIEFMKNAIKGITHLSCREQQGVELVEELTGRVASHVLDPVFLLSKKEWEKIEICPTYFKIYESYVLIYFLGEYSPELNKAIKFYKKKGYNIIYLDKPDAHRTIFASPEEFIYLIHHASLVCTDSFHGTAFSILFNVPFWCFRRSLDLGKQQDMSSRLTSILCLFGCSERMFSDRTSLSNINMNFERINEILKSEEFLDASFLALK